MAYEQTKTNLPWRISWLGRQSPITKADVQEVISELDAEQLAVVALCPKADFVGLPAKPKFWLPVFHKTVYALEENPELTDEQKATTLLPWISADDTHQKVSALLYPNGNLVPLKLVKSRYVPMQNSAVVVDAKLLQEISGGKTSVVSGGVSRDRAVFTVNMRYEDAVIEVEGETKTFKQAVTLFTSHNSSLAYSIAFSVSRPDSSYVLHWNVKKQRNTKGMKEFREQLKSDLLVLEKEAMSFIKEVELLGQIPIGVDTPELTQAIDLVVEAMRPRNPFSWYEKSATKKLSQAFEVTASVYGFNALSFYLVANEWALSKKSSNTYFIPASDLKASDFKTQSALKQFLFTLSSGGR